MVKPLFDIHTLLPSLASNTLVLTPNRRLTDKVSEAYNLYQTNQGQKAWHSLRVFPIEQWWQSQWHELIAKGCSLTKSKQLLTPIQEIFLWERVIHESKEGAILLRPAATAALAQKAYQTLAMWNFDTNHPAYKTQHDTAIFQRWASKFNRYLNQLNLITLAEATIVCTFAFEQKILKHPANIILLAFTDLPPLFKVCVEKICGNIQHIYPKQTPQSSTRVSLHDNNEELSTAANWAKNILTNNPTSTVGILIPDLIQHRHEIEHIFLNAFTPEYYLPETTRSTAPFNISAGMPLANMPIIHTAIQLINLNQYELPIETISYLLNSPFLGSSEQEYETRAMLDAHLRNLQLPNISTAYLRAATHGLINNSNKQYCESIICRELGNNLQAVEKLQIQYKANHKSTKLLPSKWFNLFRQQLEAIGWPGERALDSVEYQQVKRWFEAMQIFSTLDTIIGLVSLSRALAILQRYLSHYIFQAQTKNSPLQILGLLEAAGLTFDYIWIIGLHDKAWPTAPNPNPFIPLQLQRDMNMPYSSIEREYNFAKSLTNLYLHSAQHIIISHPKNTEDYQHFPSALIQHLPEKMVQVNKTPTYIEIIAKENQQEEIIDQITIVATDDELANIKGGSFILKNQAACPFRAFASHRLFAAPLNEPKVILTALDKGIILHYALDYLWGKLINQQALNQIDEAELQEITKDAVSHSLRYLSKHRPDIMQPRFLRLETQRLIDLLNQWLAIEKQRQSFTVAKRELEINTTFTGIPMKLRIDRIDQLDDGSYIIIDYKSGHAHVRAWEGERPDDPQLPLYSLIIDHPTSGVSFACVNNEKPKFTGIGISDEIIPGLIATENHSIDLPNNWEEIKHYWLNTLTALASDFINGKSMVSPKHVTTCQYCHLQSFCRINDNEYNE